jgi:hypothetical protein
VGLSDGIQQDPNVFDFNMSANLKLSAIIKGFKTIDFEPKSKKAYKQIVYRLLNEKS